MSVWRVPQSNERRWGWRPRRERRAWLANEVGRLLASLGATPGEVAAALERTGVRARTADAAQAPVASLLCAVVGADPGVKALDVDTARALVRRRGWRRAVAVPLPQAVRDFTAAFLAGCYPSLREARAPSAAASPSASGAGAPRRRAPGGPPQTSGQG